MPTNRWYSCITIAFADRFDSFFKVNSNADGDLLAVSIGAALRTKPPFPQSTDDRDVKGRRKRHRSAITNGKRLLPGVNGRTSTWLRRCKDIIDLHLNEDMAGADNCSAAERSLVRRAAVLTVELEMLEHRFALAEGVASADDLELYQRGTNTLRRLFESLGLQRRARDISPVPDALDYAQTRARRHAAKAENEEVGS